MKITTRNIVGFVTLTMALAACGPDSDGPSPSSAPAGAHVSDATTARPGTSTSSTSAPSEPGPDCGSAAVRDLDPGAPVACVVQSASYPGLRFEYSDTAVSQGFEGREQRIVVRDGDRVVQTITEPVKARYRTPPFVQRFANDGAGQLLAVTSTGGSGGSGIAVWRARGPKGPFVRGGDLFGFPYRVATTDEGFSAIYTHSSAVSGVYTIFRFDGDRIVKLLNLPVAAASADATPSDGSGPVMINGRTNCRAVQVNPEQAHALTQAGVLAAGYGERLCRQSWVGDTYAG